MISEHAANAQRGTLRRRYQSAPLGARWLAMQFGGARSRAEQLAKREGREAGPQPPSPYHPRLLRRKRAFLYHAKGSMQFTGKIHSRRGATPSLDRTFDRNACNCELLQAKQQERNQTMPPLHHKVVFVVLPHVHRELLRTTFQESEDSICARPVFRKILISRKHLLRLRRIQGHRLTSMLDNDVIRWAAKPFRNRGLIGGVDITQIVGLARTHEDRSILVRDTGLEPVTWGFRVPRSAN